MKFSANTNILDCLLLVLVVIMKVGKRELFVVVGEVQLVSLSQLHRMTRRLLAERNSSSTEKKLLACTASASSVFSVVFSEALRN